MKFSILLPTRNRLEYLKLAVESVRLQAIDDWEIVISDNCSEDDIGSWASSLGDARIVFHRTERPLPVTANWNQALELSSGDYVIMLGDDDALLPGYLRRMEQLLVEFSNPDLVYTKALLFTYPGVDPSYPAGRLQDHGCASFFDGRTEPFLLSSAAAREVVEATMRFRLRFDFNAQFALISRALVDRLRAFGNFYQSDFPDYYSMNAAFLAAERILIEPTPRVVIGVTPKSYGFFHANRLQNEGREFLEGAGAGPPLGSNINFGWLSAAMTLEKGIAGTMGMRTSHRRYRFVQAAHVYRQEILGSGDVVERRRVEAQMPAIERYLYRSASLGAKWLYSILPAGLRTVFGRFAHRLLGQIPPTDYSSVEGRHADILDVWRDWSARLSPSVAQQAGRNER